MLDGKTAHVVSEPLKKDLRAKTLEAWVKLGNLTQGGGAAMEVQTLNPDPDKQMFDAIVFGEQKPGF